MTFVEQCRAFVWNKWRQTNGSLKLDDYRDEIDYLAVGFNRLYENERQKVRDQWKSIGRPARGHNGVNHAFDPEMPARALVRNMLKACKRHGVRK